METSETREKFFTETKERSPDSETFGEFQLARALQTADEDLADLKKQAAPSKFPGVRESLEKLQDSATRLTRKFKRKMIVAFAATMMFQAVETQGLAQAQKEKSAIVETAPDLEKPRNNVTEEMIRLDLMTDQFERAYVKGDQDQHYTEITSSKEKTKVSIVYDYVNESLRGHNKEVSIAHTHPLQAYGLFDYNEQDLAEMRDGKERLAPAPPSIVDLQSAIGTKDLYKKKFMDAKWQIFDPTGVWEFSFDESNPGVKALRKFNEDVEKITEKLAKKYADVLQKKGWLKLSHEEIEARITEDPDLQKINHEQEEEIEKLSEKHEKIMDALGEINLAGHNVATSARNPRDVTPERIEKYKKLCQKNGIEVSYRPYQN